ncbi:MAG: hypothetical protein IKA02_05650, partial [Clostridia bacterium]|nr:hypothetical protein [Clostridia bacterium]
GVVGTFFSYIFTLFLYAMGELVEKATKTEENTREILRTSLLERQDRLDGVIESYEANSGKLSFDELIANEEDRVENKAKYDAVASLNFANLQRRFLDGKIDKEGYYNELLNIK